MDDGRRAYALIFGQGWTGLIKYPVHTLCPFHGGLDRLDGLDILITLENRIFHMVRRVRVFLSGDMA
jgi:hypothetical protein